MQSLTAVVLGATGFIGEQLVQQLLNDSTFSKVRILVRRPIKLSHPKLEAEIVNFENLAEYRHKLGRGDCIFCCIGTTQKKVKGDKNAYRKIDVDIPVNAAKMGKDAGFTNYLLVSAVGADAHSKNFYLRLKGEVEREIADLKFKSFHAFRPSILLGERKEFRFAELLGKGVMQGLSSLFIGNLKKYKGIEGENVARAMVAAAKSDGKGMYVHHYDDIIKAAS
ncbi:MAG TPA: NAD(P)H-binding protein [Segetibacter sp.]|nr:NAD(P)H-binding protein [Segetibacter sp.]